MAPEQYLTYLIWLVVKSFHSRARFVHTYAGIYKNITANTYLHTRQNFEWSKILTTIQGFHAHEELSFKSLAPMVWFKLIEYVIYTVDKKVMAFVEE